MVSQDERDVCADCLESEPYFRCFGCENENKRTWVTNEEV